MTKKTPAKARPPRNSRLNFGARVWMCAVISLNSIFPSLLASPFTNASSSEYASGAVDFYAAKFTMAQPQLEDLHNG